MSEYKTVRRNAFGKLVYTYPKEKNQAYRRAATVAHKVQSAKKNARLKGFAYNISTAYMKELWIKQEGKCALSGRPLGELGDGWNSPSIDRIDPLKGYLQDNVQWVIWRVNDAKSSMQNTEFIQLCKEVSILN